MRSLSRVHPGFVTACGPVHEVRRCPVPAVHGDDHAKAGQPGHARAVRGQCVTRFGPHAHVGVPVRAPAWRCWHGGHRHDHRSGHRAHPAAAARRFATSVTLFGYSLPTAAELGITCVFAVVFLALAVSGFGKPE